MQPWDGYHQANGWNKYNHTFFIFFEIRITSFLQQVINQTLTTAGKQHQQQPAQQPQQQVQLAVPATQAQTLQLATAQGTHAQTVQLAAPTVTIGATGQLQVKVRVHTAKSKPKKMFIDYCHCSMRTAH